MIEKIEAQADAAASLQAPAPTIDLPQFIEEEKVRDALSMSQDVLRSLADSIQQDTQANSPDGDRSNGRMSAEIFDLVSS